MKFMLQKDNRDERDCLFTPMIPSENYVNSEEASLRNLFPEAFNQFTLGSCSANAGCAARLVVPGMPPGIVLSRLYLYFKERELRDTIGEDSGASIRDICKALNKFGVCEEQYMPYIVERFAIAPSEEANVNAAQYTITKYESLNSLQHIKHCIDIHKQPVLIGIEVFNSLMSEETSRTGMMQMPSPMEQSQGGHAVLIVGYSDKTGLFEVRNSWGPNWGDHGYFYMPYEFFEKGYAFNPWTLS